MNDNIKKIAEETVIRLMDCAHQVLLAERAKDKEDHNIIRIPRRESPRNAKLVECWETAKEFVIIGDPDSEHDCDKMGCSSVSHVVARIQKKVPHAVQE